MAEKLREKSRKRIPEELKMAEKIGDFLIRTGVIKQSQIEEVLRIQQAGDNRPFGVIAIELGYTTDDILQKYIEAKEASG